MTAAIKFRPLGDRVLVKRWPQVEQHQSGLIIPGVARELPQIGRVMAVGGGRRGRKGTARPHVNVGDDVVFEKFVKTDHRIFIDNQEYLLLPSDVLYLVIVGGVRGIDVE